MKDIEDEIKKLEILISKKTSKELIKECCVQIAVLCINEQQKSTSDAFVKEKLNLVRLNAESVKKATSGMDFLGRPIVFDYEASKVAVEGMKLRIEEIKKG